MSVAHIEAVLEDTREVIAAADAIDELYASEIGPAAQSTDELNSELDDMAAQLGIALSPPVLAGAAASATAGTSPGATAPAGVAAAGVAAAPAASPSAAAVEPLPLPAPLPAVPTVDAAPAAAVPAAGGSTSDAPALAPIAAGDDAALADFGSELDALAADLGLPAGTEADAAPATAGPGVTEVDIALLPLVPNAQPEAPAAASPHAAAPHTQQREAVPG